MVKFGEIDSRVGRCEWEGACGKGGWLESGNVLEMIHHVECRLDQTFQSHLPKSVLHSNFYYYYFIVKLFSFLSVNISTIYKVDNRMGPLARDTYSKVFCSVGTN